MKKLIPIFLVTLMSLISFWACSPDSYELLKPNVKSSDLVEGIAFEIKHDSGNPNIVYLINKMGKGYTPLWNHPQGRSQEDTVTLKMPFAGTYPVQFGVETRGGVVWGDSVSFKVDNFYADFVNDELWTKLSGGVGKSKTWYLDLDANGVSRYFNGPLYFYSTGYSWESITNGAAPEGVDQWNWCPKWSENTWMMNAADFGSMTFDLKNGANVTVIHNTIPSRGTEKGLYMISTTEHTMRMTNASPLHDSNRNGQVIDWGNIRIMSLTENTMQLGVLRDAALAGDQACWLVYNFISKDYFDNWVAGEAQPPYSGNANNDLTTTSTKKWKLSETTPYNWTELDGTFVHNWSSPNDYISSGYVYNQALIKNISMSMTKTGDASGTYIFTDGLSKQITGSYTIDSKNNIDFGQNISFTLSGNISLATTSESTLRVIKSETDALGNLSGIWLGQRLSGSNQYLVYHFELVTGNSSDTDSGTNISFDASKIIYGDFENKGNLRIEIYNAYGSTANNPPVNPSDFDFSNSVEVTFTISGMTLNSGASGNYKTAISYADGDWSAQYWGGGSGDTQVTGNGTYTVYCSPGVASGIMVFVIDISSIINDIQDLSAVKIKVDKIVTR